MATYDNPKCNSVQEIKLILKVLNLEGILQYNNIPNVRLINYCLLRATSSTTTTLNH